VPLSLRVWFGGRWGTVQNLTKPLRYGYGGCALNVPPGQSGNLFLGVHPTFPRFAHYRQLWSLRYCPSSEVSFPPGSLKGKIPSPIGPPDRFPPSPSSGVARVIPFLVCFPFKIHRFATPPPPPHPPPPVHLYIVVLLGSSN